MRQGDTFKNDSLLDDKVSILIRFHDSSKLEDLSIALLSLSAQSFEKVEPVILTQRFSRVEIDAVERLLECFAWHAEVRPRVINVERSEPADLRTHLLNVGVRETGDARYLGVLDYDDFAGQEHCDRLISRLRETDAAIAYSGTIIINQNSGQHYKYAYARRFVVRKSPRLQGLYSAPHYQMTCFIVDRGRIEARHLYFDESIVYEEDYNLQLKISLNYKSDFVVATEAVPAMMRTLRNDGSNSVLTAHDHPEETVRKRELLSAGRRANSKLRQEFFRDEFDPFVMLWVEPLPIRGGRAFNWVIYNMGLGLAQLPQRNDYGHIRVAYSARYSELVAAFDQKSWCFRQDCDTVKMLEQVFGPRMDWDAKSVNAWKELMNGGGQAYDIELILLEKAYRIFPFQTILTFGVNGAARSYANEQGLSHISLELGPTRAPFIETGHCDPFGVNGDSVLSMLPRNTVLPPLESERWLETFVARIGTGTYKIPDVILTARQQGKRVALLPLQLADDANFLLHADNYSTFRDFLEDVVPKLIEKNWVCIVRPHPSADRCAYTRVDNTSCRDWCCEQHPELVIWCDAELTSAAKLGLIYHSDAVVTVNSSVGFEAMLLGTPTVTMGRSSFGLQAHTPALKDLLGGDDLEKFTDLQRRLVAFNLFHHLVPVGDLFLPGTLMRRIEEARAMKAAYESGGPSKLLEHLIENVRTRLIDYLSMGKNPLHVSPSSMLRSATLSREVRL